MRMTCCITVQNYVVIDVIKLVLNSYCVEHVKNQLTRGQKIHRQGEEKNEEIRRLCEKHTGLSKAGNYLS